MDFFGKLFNTDDFPARWHCGLWTPWHGWLHIISDVLIWSAYMAIPIVMVYFMRRKKDLAFPAIGWLFAAFIFSCGTGHLIEAGIFWWPNYRLSGIVKFTTAAVSWATVIAMVPVVPRALELPGLPSVIERLKNEVAERERTEAELENRNRDLETLMHVISHDLREPVRTLVGLTSLLQNQSSGELGSRTSETLSRINASGLRLNELILDIQEYSQARNAETEAEPVPLGEVVGEAIARLEPQVSSSAARINVITPLPTVCASRTWVNHGVYNLLSNAIKFSKPGHAPEIEIAAYTDSEQGQTGLCVRDRGIGIPENKVESIFGLFYRTVNRDIEGTGTGLAIVTEVARKHGGRAWAENRTDGGAAFYLTFGDLDQNAH